MAKTRPFTKRTLLKYPDFDALPAKLKEYALSLFDEDRLNSTGNFKRAPNHFLFFRCERLAQISDQCKATSGSKATGCPPQKEISSQMRDEWDRLPTEAKRAYELQATAADEEIRNEFPYYEYTPVDNTWWKALNKDGQKRFFFETLLRICEVQVNKSNWQGYLVIQRWAQLPENAHYVNQCKLSKAKALNKQHAATHRRAVQGSGNEATASSRPQQQAFHPYNAARMPNKPKQTTLSLLDNLKSELVYLGPRVPGGPQRMLELLLPQPQEVTVSVYTEVEIPLGTPPDIVEQIKLTEGSIPNDALILWDYTKPKQASTLSPNTTLTQPASSHDSIHKQPRPARSPPAYSTVASSSRVTSNVSPTIPVQTEMTNNAPGASHSNCPSDNLTTQGNSVVSTASGSALPPLEQIPATSFIATYPPPPAWSVNIPLGPSYGGAALDDYSVGADIDAQLSWLSALRPTQSDHTTPNLQAAFALNPSNQMNRELQDYFDRTLQEHEAFLTF